VLELWRPDLSVIRCCARPAELEDLGRPELYGRIAPDELIVLPPSSDAARVLAEISAELGRLNEAALVIDHSDAFFLIAMSGSAHDALARLSPVPVPADGFVQGPVAGVPCKFFVTSAEILLLAPSTYAHHLRERIRVACADLDVHERASSGTAWRAKATTG
jgi:hypothetical protein